MEPNKKKKVWDKISWFIDSFGTIILVILLGILLFKMVHSNTNESKSNKCNIVVRKDNAVVLEYTGDDNSINGRYGSYTFAVDDKTYYFDNVDAIEVTRIPEEETE